MYQYKKRPLNFKRYT